MQPDAVLASLFSKSSGATAYHIEYCTQVRFRGQKRIARRSNATPVWRLAIDAMPEDRTDIRISNVVDGPVKYLASDDTLARRQTQATKLASFLAQPGAAASSKVVRA